jgi:hypothetical protein
LTTLLRNRSTGSCTELDITRSTFYRFHPCNDVFHSSFNKQHHINKTLPYVISISEGVRHQDIIQKLIPGNSSESRNAMDCLEMYGAIKFPLSAKSFYSKLVGAPNLTWTQFRTSSPGNFRGRWVVLSARLRIGGVSFDSIDCNFKLRQWAANLLSIFASCDTLHTRADQKSSKHDNTTTRGRQATHMSIPVLITLGYNALK